MPGKRNTKNLKRVYKRLYKFEVLFTDIIFCFSQNRKPTRNSRKQQMPKLMFDNGQLPSTERWNINSPGVIFAQYTFNSFALDGQWKFCFVWLHQLSCVSWNSLTPVMVFLFGLEKVIDVLQLIWESYSRRCKGRLRYQEWYKLWYFFPFGSGSIMYS